MIRNSRRCWLLGVASVMADISSRVIASARRLYEGVFEPGKALVSRRFLQLLLPLRDGSAMSC